MPFPRVMGDAVHLPDGTVFICNGGQVGKRQALLLASKQQAGLHAFSPPLRHPVPALTTLHAAGLAATTHELEQQP